MKVFFITNSPSPYRVDFYNELVKKCEVTVIFEEAYGKIHDNSWKNLDLSAFTSVVMCDPNERNTVHIIKKTIKYLKSHTYDYLICEGCMPPLRVAVAAYCRATHRRYWVDADGGFPKNGFNLRELAKRFIYSHAVGAFSSGRLSDEYFLHYGVAAERLHRYPFTSISQKDIDTYSDMLKKEKQYYRELLGIKEKKVIIAVGRFVPGKGFDILMKSAVGLPEDVGVYFIGGKPTDEYISLKQSLNLDNVHFIDFVLKDKLSLYYLASDIFVLPTRSDAWGLVINEAMAHGLPVISTDMCVAALELIDEGVNGSVIHVDDVEKLHNKLEEYLADGELCKRMGQENLHRIREYTTEKMADAYFCVLDADYRNSKNKLSAGKK